jgi:hypothetical protein
LHVNLLTKTSSVPSADCDSEKMGEKLKGFSVVRGVTCCSVELWWVVEWCQWMSVTVGEEDKRCKMELYLRCK